MANALLRWKAWPRYLPQLQSMPVKVMQPPTSFAAGERAFSIAGDIQSVLRTRLSDERLHRLPYKDRSARALLDADVDPNPKSGLDDGCHIAAVDGVAVDDDASGVGIGSDSSLSDVADIAEMLAFELATDDGVVQELGGDLVHRLWLRTGLLEMCKTNFVRSLFCQTPAALVSVLYILPRTFDAKVSKVRDR